jgi:amino acid transporter
MAQGSGPSRIGGKRALQTDKSPQALSRSMKILGALFLALSAATPASSVFVILPEVVSEAGSGALISMIGAALIAICVAQAYAELGSAFPLAGGEYSMASRTLGPFAGFVVLGLNLVNSLLAAAVLALGIGDYLGAGVLGLSPTAVAVAAVICATLLSVLNIRTNAFVTGAFVAVELIALVVLAALGFGEVHRGLPQVLAHPLALNGHALVPAPAASIGLAVAVAIFAYDGYGAAVYFGEELHEAPRHIGRAIVWALAITVAAEIIPLAAVLMGAPDLRTLLGSDAVFPDFIRQAGGPLLERVLSLGVALAIFNAVIATVLLTSRQFFSMGRDATWPAPVNAAFTRLHRRFHSPWAATLTAGALAVGLCFVGLKLLLIATGTGTAIVYGAVCLSALAGRRTGATDHGHHRMPWFPWIMVATLLALAGVLAADWADPDEGRPGLIIALGVALAFGAYYLAVLKPKGWLGPKPEGGRT